MKYCWENESIKAFPGIHNTKWAIKPIPLNAHFMVHNDQQQ